MGVYQCTLYIIYTNEAATCVYQYTRHIFLDSPPPMKTLAPRTPVNLLRVYVYQYTRHVIYPSEAATFMYQYIRHIFLDSPSPMKTLTPRTPVKLLRVFVSQYTRNIFLDSPQAIKVKALYSLQTLANTIPATQCHMSEDLNLSLYLHSIQFTAFMATKCNKLFSG